MRKPRSRASLLISTSISISTTREQPFRGAPSDSFLSVSAFLASVTVSLSLALDWSVGDYHTDRIGAQFVTSIRCRCIVRVPSRMLRLAFALAASVAPTVNAMDGYASAAHASGVPLNTTETPNPPMAATETASALAIFSPAEAAPYPGIYVLTVAMVNIVAVGYGALMILRHCFNRNAPTVI